MNNFMILQLFLALEHKTKQNICLRFFSFVANSLKQNIKRLKIKNYYVLKYVQLSALLSLPVFKW